MITNIQVQLKQSD